MSETHQKSPVVGIILIALGILFLLSNFDVINISFKVIWTYIIIFLGFVFWLGFFFDRSNFGLLMPGTVLLMVGLLFNYAARRGWESMSQLWPFFILAPAFGFYAMFIFGKRDRGLLFPAGILTIIGLFFLLQSFDFAFKLILGIILLLIGILILFRNRKDDGE